MDTKGETLMKKILASSFGLALLLAAALAIHADGPGFRHRMGPHGDMSRHAEFLAEALDLTAEQKAAAEKIHNEVAAKAEPLMEQRHQQWREIHEMLDSGSTDATALGQRLIAAHAVGEQLKALHEDAMARISALLNAEQLEKFKKIQERHHGRDGEEGFRGHHGHGF
jgi:Spy/CpxP family protein refolding chaperone